MRFWLPASLGLGLALLAAAPASAAIVPATAGAPEMVRTAVYLSMLAFLPAIVICMTSFVRTVIVPGAPHFWMWDPIDEPTSFPGSVAPRLLRFLQQQL